MQYHEPGHLGPAARAAAELLRSPPASLREAWHSQLAALAPDRSVPPDVLDRHFDEVARHVADVVESSGAPRPVPRGRPHEPPLWPARLGAGFDLDLLVVEYAALRAAVTSVASGAPAEARDVEPERVGLAVDRAIAELGAALVQGPEPDGALAPEVLLERLPVGVVVLDAAGTVRYANGRAAEILGPDVLTTGATVPLPGVVVIEDQDEPGEHHDPPLAGVLRTGESVAGAQVRVERDGRAFTLRIGAVPLTDASGSRIGALGVIDDVTSTRLAFEASQHEVKVREQLMSIVSHDLRNLLTPMFVGAQVLSRLEGPPALERRVHRTAEGIQRSSQRMARLIDDLVDWGTIQAGKLKVSLSPVEAVGILRESIELFRPVALDRGVRLAAEPTGELGRVVCDRDRVLQALSNLLSNALKVVGAGGSVRVGAERRTGELLLWVADDGPGLPSAGRDHLFERYWRGSEPGYKGTGLGLAITKGIVDAHGGRIWADSEPGNGTTFWIALPDREPSADRGS